MSKYVELDYLKAHTYVDDNSDDTELQNCLDAAEEHTEKTLQTSLETYVTDGQLRADLKHAIVILAATFYANREAVAYGNPQPVPFSYSMLIKPYIKYNIEEVKP